MTARLIEQGDPRMAGEGHIFDEYPNMCSSHQFWNRRKKGEKMKTAWINRSDFDPDAEAANDPSFTPFPPEVSPAKAAKSAKAAKAAK